MTKQFWPFKKEPNQPVRLLTVDELDLRVADIGCAVVFMNDGTITAISHTYPFAAPVVVNDLASISCFHDVLDEEIVQGLADAEVSRWVVLHLKLDPEFPRMSEIVVQSRGLDGVDLAEELSLLLQKGPDEMHRWQAVLAATVRRYVQGRFRRGVQLDASKFSVPAIDADALDWLKEYWRILGYQF